MWPAKLAHQNRSAGTRLTGLPIPTKEGGSHSHGDQSPNPWDLPLSRQQKAQTGQHGHPVLPAPEPALRSLPSVAVSSAQVASVCHSLAEIQTSISKIPCRHTFRHAITTLVLTYFLLAGFEVTIIGRFLGDRRGLSRTICAFLRPDISGNRTYPQNPRPSLFVPSCRCNTGQPDRICISRV